jgi:hypothetical protein
MIDPVTPIGFLIPIQTDKTALSPVRFPAIFIEISAFPDVAYVGQGQGFISLRLIFPENIEGETCFRRIWQLHIACASGR